MNITILHRFGQSTSTIIIPIIQNDTFAVRLKNIADFLKVSTELISQDFKGNFKEVHIVYPSSDFGVKRIYLLGLGKSPNFSKIILAFRSFGFRYKSKLSDTIGIDFTAHDLNTISTTIEAAINGLVLSQYELGIYKTEGKTPHPLENLVVFTKEETKEIAVNAADKGLKTGETQRKIFDLVNMPANKATPRHLADWALNSGKEFGYRVKVIGKTQAEELGLHALLAVNQGSELPPYFIIMEYESPEATEETPTYGLVGKGITYDTGGLNIKTAGMYYMKSDMGGAASVLGAMELTAKLGLPIKLIGIVPTTDNCVDAKSVRPSDVINSYSGKTIEIIDTDAEGRLVLADGLAYMVKNYQPDVMIDLATLTGSAVRALGKHAAALFSKNEVLVQQLYDAGMTTGERLWRLPLWDEYQEEMNSDVADIKNLGSTPLAGATTAAKFLEFFTEKHPKWAHIDIAAMAFGDSEFGKGKHGTAFGVRLLVEFFGG